MEQRKVGIAGYGNLGRGVEIALSHAADMSLAAVFTRRDPSTVKTLGAPVYPMQEIANHTELDVVILCGGSATDLPTQTPELAKTFNLVDSFDTHAKIPEHFAAVDAAAKQADKVAVISAGWDPGLFSMQRILFESVLPQGETYTFWGKGVSQGHSDAIRRVPGVANGIQYTIPIQEAVDAVRTGTNPTLTTRQKHLRECYVVPEEGADQEAIRRAICEMPNYFSDYDTVVHFITAEELKANHSGMPHGGFVIRGGETSSGTRHVTEFSLKLDSNPEFTASVLVACARAAVRMNQEGDSGAKTVFDIPLAKLSTKSAEQLRKELL